MSWYCKFFLLSVGRPMLIVVFIMLVLIVFRHMYFLSVELGSYVRHLGMWLLMVKPFEVWLYSFYLFTSSTIDFEHGNEIELVLMRGISGTRKLFLIYGK
jgi:hypothetical protein